MAPGHNVLIKFGVSKTKLAPSAMIYTKRRFNFLDSEAVETPFFVGRVPQSNYEVFFN
jgi:hypothetical protein